MPSRTAPVRWRVPGGCRHGLTASGLCHGLLTGIPLALLPGVPLVRLRALLLALLPGLLLAACSPAPGAPAGGAPAFRLVHVADSHWAGGSANRTTRQVLAEIARLEPKPQWLIHGGDISEVGAAGEYDGWLDALRDALGALPARHLPGNHDGRWLDAGLAQFHARFGSPRQSFDLAGVHVVLLDVTIPAATHGHLDRTLLEWLRRDLAEVGRRQPVILFFHHPVAYTPLQFTDTDDELFAALAPYNVRAIFTGHGHLHMRWQRNNIPLFMTRAASEGGYKVLEISGGKLRVLDGAVGQAPVPVAEIPLDRPARAPRVALQAVRQGRDGLWRVTIQTSRLPAGTQVWYRLDSGDWSPAAPGWFGRFHGQVAMAGQPAGRYRLQVWAAPPGAALPGQPMTAEQWRLRDLGPSWSDFRDLEVGGSPPVAWRYRAPAGIQAPPEVGGGRAYVADLSGRLAALDLATGARRWQVETGAPAAGSPALDGDRLALANTAGLILALDPATGREIWRFQAEAPVLAQPLWAAGHLIVGDAAGNLYGLDRSGGTLRWRYRAGGAIRARAAYGEGTVFVGAWDQTVHAVDAVTGRLRWQRTLPGGLYFSPANQPPLYFRSRVFVTRSQPAGGHGLYALDARDGRVLWSSAGSFGYSAPVAHGGLVAVATTGGTVHAFDPVTGARQWSAATGLETFDGALGSYGADLVLSGLRGWVAAVGTTGARPAEKWRFRTGAAYNYARPAGGPGLLLVATMDGTLWALAAG